MKRKLRRDDNLHLIKMSDSDFNRFSKLMRPNFFKRNRKRNMQSDNSSTKLAN